MSFVTNAAPATVPVLRQKSDVINREFAEMPAPEGEMSEYYVYIDDAAPFNSCSLLGQSFTNYYQDPDASLVENRGKPFFPRMPRMPMAPNQLEAIKLRAKQKQKFYKEKIRDKDGNIIRENRKHCLISDYLIIELASSGFKPQEPKKLLSSTNFKVVNEKNDSQELSSTLLKKQQGKAKPKTKTQGESK